MDGEFLDRGLRRIIQVPSLYAQFGSGKNDAAAIGSETCLVGFRRVDTKLEFQWRARDYEDAGFVLRKNPLPVGTEPDVRQVGKQWRIQLHLAKYTRQLFALRQHLQLHHLGAPVFV